MTQRITALDLFCGAGGVSQALKQYGNIVGAVEYDPIIAETYKLNHGEEHLIVKDIRKISSEDWLEYVKLPPGKLDLLVATPPCQGFSRHSRKKITENKDERNELILEISKVVNIFHPKFIMLENVDNIINFKVFHNFLEELVNLEVDGTKRFNLKPSYHINFKVVNANSYGVPQKRKRLILLAKKIDSFPNTDAVLNISDKNIPFIKKPLEIWPKEVSAPTLGEYLSRFNISPLKAGEKDQNDPLHIASGLSDLNLRRIKATPNNGGSRDAWPEELLLNCHRKKNVSFSDVYGRMDYNRFAPTITCGCTSYSKGRFGHPIEDRAITLREAALIQTFPMDYKFTGSITGEPYKGAKHNIATQIGNAVPVKLAEAFVREIVKYV
ncbi:DNA cytosine methyltransferase [Bacillus wiedmannii]|uniref:DNA cytosine methyltransferase n=1 Tax=Bacillus wiedmannii TaxID=1890302 RepID=UPI000BF3CA94|nr:DNA cytosine methyltransferase [Bacillus wiedmannii]PGE31565.1 DNA (cytosine-5-)-methyltransferase [Bacillus wiedmannii]PHA35480.1 DNA (cytosine-5-)-methyltransferase [Bacillus wiedmannii]